MCTSRVVFALVALLSLNDRAAVAQENDTAEIAAAVTRSLTLLQASGRTWIERSGCVSCHHQALPAVSFAQARTRGFRLDEEATRERIQATLARFAPSREDLFQNPLGIGLIGGGALGAGYALLGLAAADVPPSATTDAMVHYIAERQLNDGRFHSPDPGRLPLEGSDVTATALGVRALQRYAPGGLKDEVARIIQRARHWLLSIQPRGTEEKSYQLQGLAWANAEKRESQHEWPRSWLNSGPTVAGRSSRRSPAMRMRRDRHWSHCIRLGAFPPRLWRTEMGSSSCSRPSSKMAPGLW